MAFGGERGGPLNHISLMEEDSGGHMCLLMCACLRERERDLGIWMKFSSSVTMWGFDRDNV